MKGLLLVDKPKGPTSHDVVEHIRRAARIRKVGHTGTLDPAATGLLILCLGVATRLTELLTRLDKVYEGAMLLGRVTDSHDLDGKTIEENPVPEFRATDIERVLEAFTGDILQVPPMISAVRIGGQRLYKRARRGETIERPPRRVTVREFTMLELDLPYVHFRMGCTSGTYVRSLCHDVGQRLGCGAALANLRRTRVGKHAVRDAKPLDTFATPEDVNRSLLPVERALDIPEVTVRPERRRAVAAGNMLYPDDFMDECPVEDGWLQIKSDAGALLALAKVNAAPTGRCIHPKRVLGE
ncbi:MAG TPA: tRNA pseudouridine(55) synthase TruB [Candidatus Hydrogenedentes bacterium]|nr:tRNA pseudouridine(55) synthase TruB [Candidatus Hydrogenedentota bacterium]HIJ74009.1 tRNA pseudouridine(55) synthase TruB [Candidatus Hydrogenedentota bacterium]